MKLRETYYKRNRDNIRTQQKKYYRENKEKIKARNRKLYLKKREKILGIYRKEWYTKKKREKEDRFFKARGWCKIMKIRLTEKEIEWIMNFIEDEKRCHCIGGEYDERKMANDWDSTNYTLSEGELEIMKSIAEKIGCGAK